MDKKYKDIQIIDRTGDVLLIRRMCIEISISGNIITYKNDRDNIVHELCLLDLKDIRNRGLKVVID